MPENNINQEFNRIISTEFSEQTESSRISRVLDDHEFTSAVHEYLVAQFWLLTGDLEDQPKLRVDADERLAEMRRVLDESVLKYGLSDSEIAQAFIACQKQIIRQANQSRRDS